MEQTLLPSTTLTCGRGSSSSPPSACTEGDDSRCVFRLLLPWLGFLDQGNKQKDSTLLFLGDEGKEGRDYSHCNKGYHLFPYSKS